MRTFTRREKAIAAAAGVVLGLFALEASVISPWRTLLSRKDAEIRAGERRIRRAKALLLRKDRLRRDYEEVSKAPGATSPMDMTAFLKEVESAARAAGVRIKDLRPADDPGRRGKHPAVSVTIEASWPALARLIHDLSRPARLTTVEKASLQVRPDASGLLSAQLLLSRSPLGGE